MKKIILFFAILSLMLAGVSSAARYNYTWKDADGVLNITDYPPPEDVEIIDISVIPMPEENPEDKGIEQQNVVESQNNALNRLQAEAASLRKEEAALRRNAADLTTEAQELIRISKKVKYKRRYRVRAGKKEREAEALISKADALAKQAEALEKQAAQLK